VLVTVFASASPGALDAPGALAERIASSLTAGAAMLALALVVVLVLIPRRQPAPVRVAEPAAELEPLDEPLLREAA
jgi:hypothetical protein